MEEYPDLEIEDIRQSLRFAAVVVDERHPRHLLAEALQLPAEERAALAGQLIESLDQQVDDNVEATWSVETQRRLQP